MLVLRERIVLRGAREQFSSLAVAPAFDSLDPATRIGVVEEELADADDAEEADQAEPDDMLMDERKDEEVAEQNEDAQIVTGGDAAFMRTEM